MNAYKAGKGIIILGVKISPMENGRKRALGRTNIHGPTERTARKQPVQYIDEYPSQVAMYSTGPHRLNSRHLAKGKFRREGGEGGGAASGHFTVGEEKRRGRTEKGGSPGKLLHPDLERPLILEWMD